MSTASPTPQEFQCLRKEGFTIQEIAERWHFATRRSVHRRLKQWRAAGLLDDYSEDEVNNGRRRAKNGRIVRAG